MWDFRYELETAIRYFLYAVNLAVWTHNLLTIW